MEKLTDIYIAVDFSQRAGAATERWASAQINVAKARLPVFLAIRQLKQTACAAFSGAIDSNTPVASVQVRFFWNTTATRLYRGIIHRVTRSHPVNNNLRFDYAGFK